MTRTWAFQPWGTSALDRIVASAAAHHQKLILSLADGPSNCETDGAPLDGTGQPSHGKGKQNAWYASGYQATYLPWASAVAARYSTSTAIGMWEIMNEAGSQTTVDTTTMKTFMDNAAAAIKAADPHHLVETGTLAEYTPGTTDYQLIHSGPDIDVGSLHEYDYDYDYDQSNTIVSPHLAATLHGLYVNNKPLIVGETGILSGSAGCRTSLSGRSTADRQKFDSYLLSGAAGVLVWNYSPNSPTGCTYTVAPNDPLLGLVSGYAMPAPVPAPASSGTIVARSSGKCLAVTGSSTTNGTDLQQSSCLGSPNQSFRFTPTDGGFYEIISNSNKCLDVAGQSLSNNALIDQWDCWGGDNQQFRLVPTGSYYQLVVRGSERCLNIVGASTTDGALLQQYTCNAGTNEQFTVSS